LQKMTGCFEANSRCSVRNQSMLPFLVCSSLFLLFAMLPPLRQVIFRQPHCPSRLFKGLRSVK
jgi:hypothetical protein